jgi:hypothetical protein
MDQEDQGKVSYFMSLLLSQSKYSAMQKEISLRRKEIRQGKSLTHKEFWNELQVYADLCRQCFERFKKSFS